MLLRGGCEGWSQGQEGGSRGGSGGKGSLVLLAAAFAAVPGGCGSSSSAVSRRQSEVGHESVRQTLGFPVGFSLKGMKGSCLHAHYGWASCTFQDSCFMGKKTSAPPLSSFGRTETHVEERRLPVDPRGTLTQDNLGTIIGRSTASTRRAMARHFMARHFMARHFMARHLLARHLLARHLLTRHLLTRHLLARHLLARHLLARHLLARHLLARQRAISLHE